MTPTKLLIGQILVVFATMLTGIWFVTQWAAAELACQTELGGPRIPTGLSPLISTPLCQEPIVSPLEYLPQLLHIIKGDRQGRPSTASGFDSGGNGAICG